MLCISNKSQQEMKNINRVDLYEGGGGGIFSCDHKSGNIIIHFSLLNT